MTDLACEVCCAVLSGVAGAAGAGAGTDAEFGAVTTKKSLVVCGMGDDGEGNGDFRHATAERVGEVQAEWGVLIGRVIVEVLNSSGQGREGAMGRAGKRQANDKRYRLDPWSPLLFWRTPGRWNTLHRVRSYLGPGPTIGNVSCPACTWQPCEQCPVRPVKMDFSMPQLHSAASGAFHRAATHVPIPAPSAVPQWCPHPVSRRTCTSLAYAHAYRR